jgi:hypothetical protein
MALIKLMMKLNNFIVMVVSFMVGASLFIKNFRAFTCMVNLFIITANFIMLVEDSLGLQNH